VRETTFRIAHPKRWTIRSKIVVPFIALVVLVMGLSATATVRLFNRYADDDIDRALRRMLRMVTTTGNFYDAEFQNHVKTTLGAEVIGSDANGEVIATTLDRSDWSPTVHETLARALRDGAQSPNAPQIVSLRGTSYRVVHGRLPADSPVALVTLMMPLRDADRAKRDMTLAVVGWTLAGILLVAYVGNRIARTLTTPVRELADVTRAVADGDWSRSATVRADDEVGQLAKAFNEMTAQLRRSREQLVQAERLATAGQMAATFAHEIGNPLSSIKMMMQLASEQTDDPKLSRYIENTLVEIDRLNDIVEGMLDFSRPALTNLRPCDLRDVVENVLELMGANFAHHAIRVSFEARATPTVRADPDALKRVFLNLLLNSMQAQPNGGEIVVTIDAHQGFASVDVADTGKGFTDEAIQALFRPFFTTKTRGSGLGLATVRRIVEQHGGEVAVENRANGGAVVRVTLPLVTPEGAAPA
jgi:signal transduction histidine kinase